MSYSRSPEMTARMDEIEDAAFRAELDAFAVSGGMSARSYIPDYIRDLESGRIDMGIAKDAIRSYALQDTSNLPRWLLDEGIERLRSSRPYLSVVREVAKPMAVAYFRVLKTYLDRQRSGAPVLDDLRDEIALRAGLLMRQVEGVIEDWNELPRRHWEVDTHEKLVKRLIDWDLVKRETQLYNIFPDSRWNHYVGEARDPETDRVYPFAATHTQYSGLRPKDLLLFLNDRLPVQLQTEEVFRSTKSVVAVVHPDGRVDLGDPRDGQE
jgi:hypothetical protein